MGRICQTQTLRAQPNPIKLKPMRINPGKCLRTFLEYLNLSKPSTENIETLSQKQNMEKTFSLSQDMAENVGSGGKLLGEQDSLMETWTIVGESGQV